MLLYRITILVDFDAIDLALRTGNWQVVRVSEGELRLVYTVNIEYLGHIVSSTIWHPDHLSFEFNLGVSVL